MTTTKSYSLLVDDTRFVRFPIDGKDPKYLVLVRCAYYSDAETLSHRQWETLSLEGKSGKQFFLDMAEVYSAAVEFMKAKLRDSSIKFFYTDTPQVQKAMGDECVIHGSVDGNYQLPYIIMSGAANIEDYDTYAMLGNHMVLRTQTSSNKPTSRGVYSSDELEEAIEKQLTKGKTVELEFCKINLESFVLRKRKRFVMLAKKHYVISMGKKKEQTTYLSSIIKGKVYTTVHRSRALKFINEDTALDFSFKFSETDYKGAYNIDEVASYTYIDMTFKDDKRDFGPDDAPEDEIIEFHIKHMKADK